MGRALSVPVSPCITPDSSIACLSCQVCETKKICSKFRLLDEAWWGHAGRLESGSQTLMLPKASAVITSPRDDVLQFSQTWHLHRSMARGNGENFNAADVTASAAGPTKNLLGSALIYTSAQMAALLKPQSWSLQTLPYSPRVDVSGARWRNVQRKSFVHDKLFLATGHDCFKEVLVELRQEKLWKRGQSAEGFCVKEEPGDLPKTSEEAQPQLVRVLEKHNYRKRKRCLEYATQGDTCWAALQGNK